MAENHGKVWLVGAGPSDAGLMTLRAREVLIRADTVVYDNLLGCGILSMIPASAKKIYVGKKSGNHPVPQNEINRILIKEALAGGRVVRLKGGDPFLFGRGGEELEALRKQNIPCEVVPGITSAIAVPEYAGIPVTHREYSSSLHIFTGHPSQTENGWPDFSVLAKLGGTLVFMMGVAAAKDICEKLMLYGMPKSTPAAAIENGTSARQKTVFAPISELADEMEKHTVSPPAVLVIGTVASLSETLDWRSALPLHGKRIVVTRRPSMCNEFCRKITALGGEAIAFPCIETIFNRDCILKKLISHLNDFTWITFSSSTGVDAFFETLFREGQDARTLSGIKIAAVGAMTAKHLSHYGIVPDFFPDTFDSLYLGTELIGNGLIGSGDEVLVVRSKNGSQALEKELRKSNIPFEAAEAYETGNAQHNEAPEIRKIIGSGDFDIVTFASASAVKEFAAVFPNLDHSLYTAVCIGTETGSEAQKYGMNTVVSGTATVDGMIETMAGL